LSSANHDHDFSDIYEFWREFDLNKLKVSELIHSSLYDSQV
jgi:hypothetical protein